MIMYSLHFLKGLGMQSVRSLSLLGKETGWVGGWIGTRRGGLRSLGLNRGAPQDGRGEKGRGGRLGRELCDGF